MNVELPPGAFDELRQIVHKLCGIALGDDKAYLVRHRLEPLVAAAGCATFDDYLAKLRSRSGAALYPAIIEAITTKETSFFRDGHPFETFRDLIMPDLETKARSRPLALGRPRVQMWSAAVSTGQEAYTLGMMIRDYLDSAKPTGVFASDFGILATDISDEALKVARGGVYCERDMGRRFTPAQLARHFTAHDKNYTAKYELRRLIEFRKLNLMDPLGKLGPFDVIVCRNVLIYFDEPTRRRLFEAFHSLLIPGGWLIVGAAESLYGLSSSFRSQRHGDTVLYRPVEK